MHFGGLFSFGNDMTTATQSTTEITILEDLSSSINRAVDTERGVIRNVKVCGIASKNGRVYPETVLRSSAHLYEGVPVNVNHPDGDPLKPRVYQDRFGVLRNARFAGAPNPGVYADLHYNPKHAIAEQFAWDVQNNPEAMGLSHNATVNSRPIAGGKVAIESIVRVRSADLVADPATTNSIFESEMPLMDPNTATTAAGAGDPLEMIVDSIAAKITEISKSSDDPKTKIKQIADLLKKQDKIMSMLNDKSADKAADNSGESTEQKDLREQLTKLTATLEQYQAKEQQQQRQALIEQELAAAGLNASDEKQCSKVFLGQLEACESVADRKTLIDDRAAIVRGQSGTAGHGLPGRSSLPKSQPSQPSHALEQVDAASFARRLMS